MKKNIKSVLYIFTPLILGAAVSFITKDFMDFNKLVKPFLAPPAIVFPIAWSILYLLMGYSYYKYKKDNVSGEKIDTIYYTQLFFNLMWTIIFFVFKFRFIALLWIVILDILIYLLLKLYKNKSLISYYLIIPYFIWCIFATYLNLGIFVLN